MIDWPNIVGAQLGKVTEPIKIQWGHKPEIPGKLLMLVQSGAAVMVNFQQDIIIQRVNQYFGRNAIMGIQIKQGYLPKKPIKITKPSPSENMTLDLSDVTHDSLRDALKSLGKWM